MLLPGEIRNLIYFYTFSHLRSKTAICTFPTHGPLPFISNICHSTSPITAETALPIDIFLLLVSKQLYSEASIIFYASTTFRFNTSQLGNLLLIPRMLDNISHLEIEDCTQGLRRWSLLPTLEYLSSLPHIHSVVVGTKASGTSTSPRSRTKFRLLSLHTTTSTYPIVPPTPNPNAGGKVWTRIMAKGHTVDLWRNVQPVVSDQDWWDFSAASVSQGGVVTAATLVTTAAGAGTGVTVVEEKEQEDRLGTLKNVDVVDFGKRALVEGRVGVVRAFGLV
jgi:hypothetical protein